MIKKLTSIVIPTWLSDDKLDKKKNYLVWTLDSLIKTSDKPFEIILVNNQTQEPSEKFLESFRDKFLKNKYCKRFEILTHTKNMGWTGGLEMGIENAQGEYVCFSNDDLVFSSNWLSKILKHFRFGIGAVGPTSDFTSGLQSVKENKKGVYEERVNWLIGFCMVIKRKALDQIKKQKGEMYYIDPIFYPGGSEELDVCIRLRKIGWDLLIARDVFIHHFGSKSLQYYNEFQKNQAEFYIRRQYLLLEKHGNIYKEVIETQKCPTVAIAIPILDEVDHLFDSNYHWLLQESLKYFGFDDVLRVSAPRGLVHVARSELVKTALMFGAEYVFFLDSDMIIPRDTIIRFYKYQKDFITALAYMRTPPFKPCVYRGRTFDKKWLECYDYKQGLVEIDASGLSCCLIKMDVIKKLIDKKIKAIQKRGGLFYLDRFGEDLNFTMEFKEMGAKLYCDTSLIIDHLGAKQRVNDITFISYHKQQEAIKQEKLKKYNNMGNKT